MAKQSFLEVNGKQAKVSNLDKVFYSLAVSPFHFFLLAMTAMSAVPTPIVDEFLSILLLLCFFAVLAVLADDLRLPGSACRSVYLPCGKAGVIRS